MAQDNHIDNNDMHLHPNKKILYELQRMPDQIKKETSLLYPRLSDVL